MNIDNIDTLIAAVRNEDNFFNMYNYTFKMDHNHSDADYDMIAYLNYNDQPVPACGTPACLAGWGAQLAGADMDRSLEIAAQEWLGLDWKQAHALFQPPTKSNDWLRITRQQAIDTLERLKETGVVTWALKV